MNKKLITNQQTFNKDHVKWQKLKLLPPCQCPFLTLLISDEEMLLLAKTQDRHWALFSQWEEAAPWFGAQPSPPASM